VILRNIFSWIAIISLIKEKCHPATIIPARYICQKNSQDSANCIETVAMYGDSRYSHKHSIKIEILIRFVKNRRHFWKHDDANHGGAVPPVQQGGRL